MNRKGVTLVELLTVIVILGIIAIVTTPVIVGVLNNSKKQTQTQQIKIVEAAAERWAMEHIKFLPAENDPCCVTLSNLKSYLSNTDVTNLENSSKMTGAILVTCHSSGKQYTYEYQEPCDKRTCGVTS